MPARHIAAGSMPALWAEPTLHRARDIGGDAAVYGTMGHTPHAAVFRPALVLRTSFFAVWL